MKYVLDASVALKWVIGENDSSVALQLRSEFAAQTHELIAPDVYPAECGHGLIRAERRSIINVGDAIVHLADILTTLPRCTPAYH
jgi:predicted nucleic acid-binding protein